MLKKPLFWEMIAVLAVVASVNYYATQHHLYWEIKELDSAMHFLGGVFLSLFFGWLYFFSGFFNPKERSLKNFFYISILGAIFVAVLWEVHELLIGEAEFGGDQYPFDTALDFVMDFLGALAGIFYAYTKEIK